MELNDPKQLVQMIDAMLYSMDRTGRKRFLTWIKQKRKEYDFNFPLGGTYGKDSGVSASTDSVGTDNTKQQDGAEPSTEGVKEVSDSPSAES